MRFTRCWLAPAAAVVLAGPVAAQNVPSQTLSRPDAEYAEPFTLIAGVRELRDGRVIAVDSRDKVVQVIDLKAGAAQKIGREGSGPGEYALPMRLFALPGDSSAVLDPLNRRMLVITPDAKPGGFIDLNTPTPGARGGGPGIGLGGLSGVSAVDNRGRMYLQGSPIRIVDGTPQQADSVAIERLDRASHKRDTVAFLQLPKGNTQVSGGRGNVSIRVGGGGPFSTQDQFDIAADGRVAVVHHDPYSVDFVTPSGQRVRGQPIRADRLKVSEKHKEQWREQRRNAFGIAMTNNNGRMSAQQTRIPYQEPESWPEYLPPFLTQAVTFASDGMLWVRRTAPADDPPTYDVIDPNGRLAMRVLLPQKSRVVGFGNGTVYVARSDEDDLQYLQRYRLPASARQ